MNTGVKRFEEIDWQTWRGEQATLVFVVQGGQVLLIRKKRGLGQGKINGPGGRLEPGETPAECAIREVAEELCIQVRGPLSERGQLFFQFTDGYALHVFVFLAHQFEGTPQETAEAIPLWTALEELPFDEMWADDRYWLPRMLAGERFRGRFLFDGDRMLGHELKYYV